MSTLVSLIIFIAYKALILGTAYFAVQYYKMRFDIVTLYFYLFLSFFQLLFVAFQLFSRGRKNKTGQYLQAGIIFQYTPIITLSMEIIILGLSVSYLYSLENDLLNLLQTFTVLIPLHAIYYYLHSMLFGLIIKKRSVKIKSASIFPLLLFTLIAFFEPAGYMIYKYLYQIRLKLLDVSSLNSVIGISRADIIMFVSIMIINGFLIFLFLYYKEIKAKSIYRMIEKLSIVSNMKTVPVDDPNEYGYIETGIREFQDRLIKEKGDITLLNDYISKNIRNEITKSGLKQEGEEKMAAIATIRFSISLPETAPERYVKLINSVFVMMGEYADEYEAYPFFQLNKAVIVYGVPYYYEHEKYNSIEATQKTIGDMERIIENEGGEVSIHSGLYSGSVIVGAYNTKGRGLKEYSVVGSGVEMSEKISLAAENIDAKMLVASGMIENLKNKFYPEKTFKLKMKNGEDLVVSMLKV